jgi:DNA recombination protein RmuC
MVRPMDPGIPVATTLSLLAALLVGVLLGVAAGVLWARSRGDGPVLERARAESRAGEAAVLRESLDRLHDQLRDMAQHEVSWQSQLKQQVDDVRHSTETLRRETATLSTALRRPQVRGRWGELHLRRVVELAGLVDRCDFTEQVSTRTDDQLRRPDLVVQLAGGRHLVVDAKVPLDAFLDATGSDSDDERDRHLLRHAKQLRAHVDALAAKAYWRSLPGTPEFVVLFVPGESFLAAALEADGTLLEHAADRKVVLASPSTLIALLRTVAYAWNQQTLAEKTREIHELGRDLYERLSTMAGHLDRLGRSLNGAVSSYNRAVGSLETRVLVSARRLADLGVSTADLATPEPVVEVARPLTAAELLERVAEPRPELPGLLPPPDDDGLSPARRVAR